MAVSDFVSGNMYSDVEQEEKFPVGIERKIRILGVEDSIIFEGKKTVRYEHEGLVKYSPTLKNLISGCERVLEAGREYVRVTRITPGSQFQPANFKFAGLSKEEYDKTCELEDDFEFSL